MWAVVGYQELEAEVLGLLANWRLIAVVGLAITIIGLATGLRYQTNRANALAGKANALTAQLEAEQKAREHERQLQQDATNDYEAKLARLSRDRALTPVRSVRLCKPDPAVPGPAPAPNGTAAGTAGEQPAEAGRNLVAGADIGPNLYALADEADERAAQCNALIKWVRSR